MKTINDLNGVRCAVLTAATLGAVLTLAACGGGSNGSGMTAATPSTTAPAPPPPGGAPAPPPVTGAGSVPGTATASVASFINYVGSLPADNTAEPLNTQGVTPPTTDTDEPAGT